MEEPIREDDVTIRVTEEKSRFDRISLSSFLNGEIWPIVSQNEFWNKSNSNIQEDDVYRMIYQVVDGTPKNKQIYGESTQIHGKKFRRIEHAIEVATQDWQARCDVLL